MSDAPASAPDPGSVRDDELAELCVRAVSVAAHDLGLDPALFAGELAQGEIGLMISYLRAASDQIEDLDLRERIDALLHRLTDWTGEMDGGA
ncbi:MAG TPA: hypothetical protein VFQ39_20515 [Longimicrobium sp.]|nr:hypothetical protein [Longimicrobium sp.]